MPNIGIMTYYAVQNFGAALQAFALQQKVEKFGAKAEFLRYFDKHNENTSHNSSSFINLILRNKEFRNNIIYNFPRYVRIKRLVKPNILAFKKFKSDYLNISIQPYYDFEDLKLANHKYNGFIVGSDMVWTPIGQNLEAYFLTFADKEKRFSYAPSMTGCHTYSPTNTNKIKLFLDEMNIISCREQEGVDFVMSLTGKKAELVLDPTLLLSKEEWKEELKITSKHLTKPYILCYNFGGLSKKMESEIYRIAKEKNMDVRYIPLCHKESDAELKLGYYGPYGPREFVELFLNASFVITNTFHGFLFSLISENPFIVIHREKGNTWKANETRISNLMDILGVSDRFLNSCDGIKESYLTLDYTEINPILLSMRHKSLSFLKNVVETACKNKLNNDKVILNVRDLSIKKCTGCSLCSTICPFGAIKMKENKEGFMIPQIDERKCKECGKCARICPSIYTLEKKNPINTHLCLSKDKLINNSASGGVFITLAKYFIENLNGVVYGVILDKELTCRHAEATTIEELIPMQNSKYIQSSVNDCYLKAKQRLENGQYVLFSGTPCQIAALKSYLKKDYANLITLDIVCHGVPNLKYWNKYINHYNPKDKVVTYNFRNRANKNTWDPTSKTPQRSTLEATVITTNAITYIPAQKDPFYGPFIRCESYRLSCYYCQYACKERISDITMGDCDSEKLYPDFYPYESKSIILINTTKGKNIWETIRNRFEYSELNYKEEIKANTCLGHPSIKPNARKYLYKDLDDLSWKEFEEKYVPKSSKLSLLKTIANKIIK